MNDSNKRKLLVALTVMMGLSLAPSAMADQIVTVEEATGVPVVVGPGVTEYRTVTRTTSTTSMPPARVTVTNPVVVESKTTDVVTEDYEEVSRPVAYKKACSKKNISVAPRVSQSVRTIERTIEKPIVVERPVLIDRPVDRIIQRPVDRIIERPVIIEKQVPVVQPVIIQKPVVIQKPVIVDRHIVIEKKKKKKHLLNFGVL